MKKLVWLFVVCAVFLSSCHKSESSMKQNKETCAGYKEAILSIDPTLDIYNVSVEYNPISDGYYICYAMNTADSPSWNIFVSFRCVSVSQTELEVQFRDVESLKWEEKNCDLFCSLIQRFTQTGFSFEQIKEKVKKANVFDVDEESARRARFSSRAYLEWHDFFKPGICVTYNEELRGSLAS